jgi:acetyl esterase/lipase
MEEEDSPPPRHVKFVRAHFVLTTLCYALLARTLVFPTNANFFIGFPASELSPLLASMQVCNLGFIAAMLRPHVAIANHTSITNMLLLMINAMSFAVFARASYFNLISRRVLAKALLSQAGVVMEHQPPRFMTTTLRRVLCAFLPFMYFSSSITKTLVHHKDIAYAEWSQVDPKLLARWQRTPKALKQLNARVGRGVIAKWLSLDVVVASPPSTTSPLLPVLVYIHGGGWVLGDKTFAARPLISRLAQQRQAVCVVINYRLSPEVAFPAHVEDCKRALRWVRNNIHHYGGDAEKVFVCGESACGRDYRPPEWGEHDDDDVKLKGCIPLYGVYDLRDEQGYQAAIHPSFIQGVDGGLLLLVESLVMKARGQVHVERFDLASPTFRLRRESGGGGGPCPMFVVHGTHDRLAAHGGSVEFFSELIKLRQQRGDGGMDVFASLPEAHHQFGYLNSPRGFALADAIAAWIRGVCM